MINRIFAVARARNLEFLRDRSVLMWNLVLPIMLSIGLAIVFSGPARAKFKVAVIADAPQLTAQTERSEFLQTRFIDFYAAGAQAEVVDKLEHHLVDLVVDPSTQPPRYWINEQSPSGYLVEKMET